MQKLCAGQCSIIYCEGTSDHKSYYVSVLVLLKRSKRYLWDVLDCSGFVNKKTKLVDTAKVHIEQRYVHALQEKISKLDFLLRTNLSVEQAVQEIIVKVVGEETIRRTSFVQHVANIDKRIQEYNDVLSLIGKTKCKEKSNK